MKISLLLTGKTSEKYIIEGMSLYEERLKRYSPFEYITIPDLRNTRNMSGFEIKLREGGEILRYLKSDDYVVLLDSKGKEFSTPELSSWLEKILMLQKKRLVFVIGGAWGFSEAVYERGDIQLSLSRLTFSHQIVRLLFLEQLYRAFTILKGEPYHHE